MSAFIVSRDHIRYLVESAVKLPGYSIQGGKLSWYHRGERHELRAGDMEGEARMGNMLWAENILSVLHRYPHDTVSTAPGPVGETYDYGAHRYLLADIDPVQTLKACACYEYQSCEHAEWEESEAHAIIEAIRRAAIAALPGYEDAQWEIDLATMTRPRRHATIRR